MLLSISRAALPYGLAHSGVLLRALKHTQALFQPQLVASSSICSSSAQHAHAAKEPHPLAASTFERCMQLVSSQAGGGTQFPAHARAALERVNEHMGGCWLYIQCGQYLPDHQQAGQTARAALHVAMCEVRRVYKPLLQSMETKNAINVGDHAALAPTSSSSSSSSSASFTWSDSLSADGRLKSPVPLSELPEGSEPVVVYGVYQLDSNGWPNGNVMNSMSELERQTTRFRNKKPDKSFNVISCSEPGQMVTTWFRDVLGTGSIYHVRKPHQREVWAVHKWYQSHAQQAGATVLAKENAATRALKRKMQQAATGYLAAMNDSKL